MASTSNHQSSRQSSGQAKRQSNLSGGCLCGAIRYELTGEPLFVHACHCTDCQKRSGSAFGITVMVAAHEFRLLGGEPGERDATADSGNVKRNHFCRECGCSVFGTNPGQFGTVSVRGGTLDDTRGIEPLAHIWTRSKQSWVKIGPNGHDKHYDRAETWPEDSRRRLAEARAIAEARDDRVR